MVYDIIVIGSGPGGYPAAIRASQLGMKAAVIERESLGGICLNWGCIPTKALIKSAQVFEYLRHAGEYGIDAQGGTPNFPGIVRRSRDVANGMSNGIQFLMKKNKIEVIKGNARLTADKKIEVEGEGGKKIWEAKHIVVATGARSRSLPNLPIDGKKIIGYREAMVLPQQPQSMIIVGSGAIGCEFAYFYNALGTKVTLVEYMPDILPREDNEVSKTVERSFKKQRIEILTGSSVEKVNTGGEGCEVTIKSGKEPITLHCDIVLSAVGISPNTENIGLEGLGIKVEKGIVATDEFYRTNVEGIYAIGDITPGPALAHVATAEGIVCVEAIAGKNPEPIDYNNIPGCTYCSPEVASVGYTEKAAKEAGYTLKVGKFPFSASGKASAVGAKEGFVKIIYDAKYGELLGAHMVGYNVTELIAEIVVARKLEATGQEMLRAIHPHPTMSEAITEATAAAYGEVIHL